MSGCSANEMFITDREQGLNISVQTRSRHCERRLLNWSIRRTQRVLCISTIAQNVHVVSPTTELTAHINDI